MVKNKVVLKERDVWSNLANFIGEMVAKYAEAMDLDNLPDPDFYIHMPSKYPAKYRIDLHIDDDPSVMQNGKVYGFRVFLVGPPDDEWGDKILQEAMRIKCIMNKYK